MVRIYTLEDPTIEGIRGVRYVGKTVDTLEERLGKGYCGYCKNWLKYLKQKGVVPTQVEIDYVEEEDWREAEGLYIEVYRSLGCPLTNLTNGGDGVDGYTHTEETRAKMRSPKSESHRKKLSTILKGRPSPNRGKPNPKVSEARRGMIFTEEHRINLSLSLMGNTNASGKKGKRRQ